MQDLKTQLTSTYNQGQSPVSDEEYDKLVAAEDGSDELGEKGNSKHVYRMGSIRKVYIGESKLPDWVITKQVCETLKLDGLALRIIFDKMHYTSAATRGDGEYGTDCTTKVGYCLDKMGIPDWLEGVDDLPDTIQISGEVVCPKQYKNARNIAAGAITHIKDIDEFASRVDEYELAFVAYDCNIPCLDYWKRLEILEKLGFTTVANKLLKIKYPTDGTVYRLRNNKDFDEEGFTGHYKNGIVALKERKAGIETQLLDVIWQVSPQGRVVPVAILDTVEVDGANVSRATLNNNQWLSFLIAEKNLGIGSKVKVIRAGEIIPKIVEVCSAGIEEIDFPEVCPCCEEPLSEEGVHLLCTNSECSSQVAKLVQNFFSTLGVKGFGIKTSEKFNRTPQEIIKLTESQFIDIMGSTVGKKLFAQIDKLKQDGVSYQLLLQAMSIPSVGKQVSEILPDIYSWGDSPDFSKFLGNKKAVAIKLKNWYNTTFQELWNGTWPLPTIKSQSEKPKEKSDISVVVTGSVPGYTRTSLANLLAEYGVSISSSVSKKTSYLICETESTSSSYIKAKELGITILNLKSFLEKLNDTIC